MERRWSPGIPEGRSSLGGGEGVREDGGAWSLEGGGT